MPIWIRLLAIVTGVYNFAIGGRIILALPQLAIAIAGLDNFHILPMPTSPFVSGLGGLLLIVHSVRLIMGLESARRLQLWICGLAAVSRLSFNLIQLARFPDRSPLLPKALLAVLLFIVLLDLPIFLAFRSSRVRTAYSQIQADRRQRREDRELQKNLNI